jgi:hypothetical protein
MAHQWPNFINILELKAFETEHICAQKLKKQTASGNHSDSLIVTKCGRSSHLPKYLLPLLLCEGFGPCFLQSVQEMLHLKAM